MNPLFVEQIRDHSRRAPKALAVRAPGGERSVGALLDGSERIAARLREVGCAPGDRVAACLPNDVDIVVAFLAAMRLGALWVGVNRQLAAPEKAYILEDSGAALLLPLAAFSAFVVFVPLLLLVVKSRDPLGAGIGLLLYREIFHDVWCKYLINNDLLSVYLSTHLPSIDHINARFWTLMGHFPYTMGYLVGLVWLILAVSR